MKRVISGKTIAPYSPAVIFDERLVFISGQLPDIDTVMGTEVGITANKGTALGIEVQTRSVLNNLKILLEKAGAGLETVLKTTVFLTNMNDFAKFNEVYKEFFTNEPPARSTIGVAALPLGVGIEIEAIAYIKSSK